LRKVLNTLILAFSHQGRRDKFPLPLWERIKVRGEFTGLFKDQ
jgi:hypothetical protein